MNKLLTITLAMMLFFSPTAAKTIKLTTANTVTIRGSIDGDSIKKAMEDFINLHSLRSETETIYIVLDSPGGSVYHGNKFITFINSFKNVKTVCIFCASMAHAISQGVKGTRYATHDNIMMAHRARGGFQGQFEDGEVESQLKLWKSIIRSMEQRNADRIEISLKEYKKKVKDEWWTYSHQSLKEGIVDQLITLECSDDLLNTKETRTVRSLFGSSTEEISACPLAL